MYSITLDGLAAAYTGRCIQSAYVVCLLSWSMYSRVLRTSRVLLKNIRSARYGYGYPVARASSVIRDHWYGVVFYLIIPIRSTRVLVYRFTFMDATYRVLKKYSSCKYISKTSNIENSNEHHQRLGLQRKSKYGYLYTFITTSKYVLCTLYIRSTAPPHPAAPLNHTAITPSQPHRRLLQ